MRPRTLLGLAAIAVAGVAPATATAAAPPSAPAAPPAVTPTGSWPADWPVFVDYTATITFAIPPTWRHVELMPVLNDDGSPRPWLAATPDMAAFLPAEGQPDTFSSPGVVFLAYPGTVDTLDTLAAAEYHDVCAAQPVTAFTRGVLTGHLQEFHGCGGTGTRIVYVAGTIPNAPHTYLMLVQLTAADDPAILDGLLSAFTPTTLPGT